MTDKKLIKNTKDTIKLGVSSMAGMTALGSMSKVTGMPAQASGVLKTVGVGMNLLNTGQLAKNAMSITEDMFSNNKRKKSKNKI